jgi:hypothetical protein
MPCHRAVREQRRRSRPRTTQGPAAADARTHHAALSARHQYRARVHPEPPPRTLRTWCRCRPEASDPRDLRRTRPHHLIRAPQRSALPTFHQRNNALFGTHRQVSDHPKINRKTFECRVVPIWRGFVRSKCAQVARRFRCCAAAASVGRVRSGHDVVEAGDPRSASVPEELSG